MTVTIWRCWCHSDNRLSFWPCSLTAQFYPRITRGKAEA